VKTCIAVLLLLLGSVAFGQTGTWNLYPAQTPTVNQVSVDPPINSDGSSVWSSKATVPVQYDVLARQYFRSEDWLVSSLPDFASHDSGEHDRAIWIADH
jgi:hypothetical protein